jgi:hypothetical protein
MQAFLVRRGLFAASILAISAIAATGHADDGGLDSGTDAGAADATTNGSEPTSDAASADGATGTDAGSEDATTSDSAPYSEGNGYVQEDGSIPVYTGTQNIFTLLCLNDPGTTFDDAGDSNKSVAFSDIAAPYADKAGCMAYADQGHAAVHSCYCNSCFNLMQECDALEGCKEILKCALDSNGVCNDATNCYFGPCTATIDKWNNTSAASFLPFLLQQCGAAASPACPTN